MSESIDFHALFTRLQSRYPMSSLITELVQSDRPVVRALVQVGGITLVTSMATASTVEQAEDQARLRVLAMLGIDTKNSSSLPSMSMGSIPTLPPPAHFPPLPLSDSQPQPTEHPTLGATETAVTVTPEPMPRLSLIQSPLIQSPLIQPPNWGSPIEDKPSPGEPSLSEFNPSEPSPSEPSPDEPGIALDQSIAGSLPSQPENARTMTDVLVTDDLSPPEQESAMPAPMAATKTSTKPRKPATPKQPVSSELAAPPTDNLDLTELIVQIDHEMERVCWTKEEGRNYLKRTYGKRSRQQLTDDELIDFLIYLKALPNPMEMS